MPRLVASLIVCLWAGAATSACSAGDDPLDALCAAEKFHCENQEDGFVRPDRCKVDGELVLEVGQGEASFQAVPTGDLPQVHHGTQGGIHVFMAVRIGNADIEQSPTIRVRFEFVYHLLDGACAGGVRGTGDARECELVMGSRDLVLGSKQPIRILQDGTIEEFGILVFLDSAPDGVWSVRVEAEDGCLRETDSLWDIIR